MQLVPAKNAAAGPYNDQELRNLATVQHGLDAWRDGTGSPYDALADDATWEITGNSVAARIYTSKEDFMANVIRPFNARMSTPLLPTVRSLYADGDTVIAFFDAEGTARDGLPYRNTYAWFLQLRDDKIVTASAFFDSLAFNDLWQRVVPAPLA
ncbi:nuclear transport factor 2 family protein [Mycolicibacterium cosmeticum]|uniref:nuclear transport factor 2 family protein n=1 Tax=Mycolicibacterium cosmeticum TaxID=258533 RepID=UPI0032046B7C